MRAAAPYQRPRRSRAVVSRGVFSRKITTRLQATYRRGFGDFHANVYLVHISGILFFIILRWIGKSNHDAMFRLRVVWTFYRPACGVRFIHPTSTYITLLVYIHHFFYLGCSSQGTDKEGRGVFIEGSDVRAKRMARKAGSLIIFIVDASGSMALNRMNAAKGAAMSLLQEAYQSRDKICIVPFQVRCRPASDYFMFLIVQGR